jgi:tetratricopeptide (TPR) repeat protein
VTFADRPRILSVVALWLLLLTRVAGADTSTQILAPKAEQALQHLIAGNKLYSVRSFDDAAEEYKKGALVELAPIFDYNLGQCYRQLGRYQDAIWHYERFLKSGAGSEPQRSATQKFITQMRAELEQRAKSEPPTDAAPASQAATPAAVLQPQPINEMPRDARRWYSDAVGWALVGVGLTGGVIGGVLLVQASDLRDDADAASTATEAMSLRDKADRRSLIGGGVGIGGIALTVLGAVKLAVHSDSQSRTTTAITLSSDGILVFGSF